MRTADGKFNINSGTLKKVLIPAPSISEQNEIAINLAVADTKVANAEAKRSQLQDLFRTLLHELMTVKIRLNKTDLLECGTTP